MEFFQTGFDPGFGHKKSVSNLWIGRVAVAVDKDTGGGGGENPYPPKVDKIYIFFFKTSLSVIHSLDVFL